MTNQKAHKYFKAGKRYLKNNEHDSARKCFEIAVADGHIMAKAELGSMLLKWPNKNFHQTVPNTNLGLSLLRDAAEAGLKSAALIIAEFARQSGGRYNVAIKSILQNEPGPQPETAYMLSLYKHHPEVFKDFLSVYKTENKDKNFLSIGRQEGLGKVKIPREEKINDLIRVEEFDAQFSESIAQELDIDEAGLFSVKNDEVKRRVILYIPDHSYWSPTAVAQGHENRNRLHITDCLTIEDMKQSGRLERYVVTNRLKGPYTLTWNTGSKKKYNMRICINCLVRLNKLQYVKTTSKERERIALKFDVADYVSEFGTRFMALPTRRWWDDDAE